MSTVLIDIRTDSAYVGGMDANEQYFEDLVTAGADLTPAFAHATTVANAAGDIGDFAPYSAYWYSVFARTHRQQVATK